MSNYKNNLTIKQWNDDDRPREKLLNKGKGTLSNAELIAILLGTGSRNQSAVDLSKDILNRVKNNLKELGKLSVVDLVKFNGIGNAKAISIITALELGRRRNIEEALENPIISGSKSVFRIMKPILGELKHEEFWLLYLNNSNRVILNSQLSKGGLTGTVVDSRLVFKQAIEISATSVILCHNHPSGNIKPSSADINLTSKMKNGGEFLDIKVLDHVIITEKDYFSFADNNMI